jgi:crossover junction endodeoxyribonuclease RuvC
VTQQAGAAGVVLGVDPGLTRCGLGVLAGSVARPRLVDATCVRTDPDRPLEQRLLAVHDAIADAIEAHRPDAVAVEQVLFSVNVRTAMATGQAAGAALLAAARAGIAVHAYTPSEVKLTVAGSGPPPPCRIGPPRAAGGAHTSSSNRKSPISGQWKKSATMTSSGSPRIVCLRATSSNCSWFQYRSLLCQ